MDPGLSLKCRIGVVAKVLRKSYPDRACCRSRPSSAYSRGEDEDVVDIVRDVL